MKRYALKSGNNSGGTGHEARLGWIMFVPLVCCTFGSSASAQDWIEFHEQTCRIVDDPLAPGVDDIPCGGPCDATTCGNDTDITGKVFGYRRPCCPETDPGFPECCAADTPPEEISLPGVQVSLIDGDVPACPSEEGTLLDQQLTDAFREYTFTNVTLPARVTSCLVGDWATVLDCAATEVVCPAVPVACTQLNLPELLAAGAGLLACEEVYQSGQVDLHFNPVPSDPDLATARLPSPIELETQLVPADDRFRLDDDEDGAPIRPEMGQPSPEDAIAFPQPWPSLLLAQDRQLLAQSEILGSQLGAVSNDASDQGKDDSYGAHFTGLPGC